MKPSSFLLQTLPKTRFVPKSGHYPAGFSAGAVRCGIKKAGPDLAAIVSSSPCTAAAVYTQNQFPAAPIAVTREVIAQNQGNIHAVVLNSGCANAMTGPKGLEDARAMAESGKVKFGPTLVMLTGVIGQHLPMDKLSSGIDAVSKQLGSSHESWLSCAEGMMTTDTFPKLVSREVVLNGQRYSIAGLAKGAGMILPNMATLLGVIVTDAAVTESALAKILGHAVDRSFNCVSVDGDMSTNDTIALLANGKENPITESSSDFRVLQNAVSGVASELAQLLVRDGEGATKFVTLKVKGAPTYSAAKRIAASVANSALVKTALYGRDANWGRILAAVGYTDFGSDSVKLDPSKLALSFIPSDGSEPLVCYADGGAKIVDEERASQILADEEFGITIDLGLSNEGEECTYWTCDLSHDYVTINGDYRS